MGLYRQFILMVGDLRRWHVCTLIDGLKFHFDLALFIKRRKVQVRGLEFRGKVNQIKKLQHSFLCALGGGLYLALGGGHLTLEYNGSDAILMVCSPPGAQRWNCL